MRLTFLGGADEVGGSSLLIEISGRRVLIDAGIRPSPKARWGLSGDQLPHLSSIEQLGDLDAILVTHAHTDHTGALELVVGRYSHCPVYATPPTITLTRVLHQDARRIMQSRLDEEGELPLFDDVATQKLLSACVPAPFHTRVPLGESLAATFYPAGHIAGAAMIGLESDEGRVLISGDVSISPQRTVDGAKPPPFRPDVLILESTYSGRLHANRSVEEHRLVERVVQVTRAGGKVLIPAFALGRAQELIQILSAFRRAGELSSLPVWVDGMVRAVCGVYAQFPEVLPLALQERGARFFDEFTRAVERVEQRNALVWEPSPAVIISSSGMLAGGPSLSYAHALAGQPQHAILLTGYQDEESPGRRLQEMAVRGRGSLKLGKSVVDVQCQLGTYGLSAHADEGQLVSLTETLDPSTVLLVHGDAAARESMLKALRERGRRVGLPRAGQSFEFSFAPALTARRVRGIGGNRPLDLKMLWQAAAAPGGNYFALEELARMWWGDTRRAAELRDALEKDDAYFVLDARGLVRARTREQIERIQQRVNQLSALGDLSGAIVILRDGEEKFLAARVNAVGRDHFRVQGEDPRHFPEEIVEVIGTSAEASDVSAVEALAATLDVPTWLLLRAPRSLDDLLESSSYVEKGIAAKAALALALLRAGATHTPAGYLLAAPPAHAPFEPNQALAFAREQFPPEARLRRVGYRLDQRALVLAFDFPDVARERWHEILRRVESETGWRVEIEPEANQAALAALAREVLPRGWEIVKGPSIYREVKRVALTARRGDGELDTARELFRATTGYTLSVTVGEGDAPIPQAFTPTAGALEINAAYALIRRTLAGSTLYRTSLKGNEIVLSFISPQVGARYQQEIETLAQSVGWALSINPQPNQNAILEAAQRLIKGAGWSLARPPSIHTDRGEVAVALSTAPDIAARTRVEAEFEAQTGYHLRVGILDEVANPPKPESPREEPVEITVARIRLTGHQQSLSLDADRQRKAIAQLQRDGRLSKPIRVRRAADGYILLDGSYRLRAAQALGWERIPAVVED